jgi:hypothetical protein
VVALPTLVAVLPIWPSGGDPLFQLFDLEAAGPLVFANLVGLFLLSLAVFTKHGFTFPFRMGCSLRGDRFLNARERGLCPAPSRVPLAPSGILLSAVQAASAVLRRNALFQLLDPEAPRALVLADLNRFSLWRSLWFTKHDDSPSQVDARKT